MNHKLYVISMFFLIVGMATMYIYYVRDNCLAYDVVTRDCAEMKFAGLLELTISGFFGFIAMINTLSIWWYRRTCSANKYRI